VRLTRRDKCLALLTAKPKHRCSVFTPKQVFGLVYCQISTDLDKILHTPIVARNTLEGRLRPRSAREKLQAKPKRLRFSVILVTHPKSCIEITDRRDFVKVEVRTGAIVKNSGIGNSFTPNQRYCWKAETLKVCLLLVWRVCDQEFGRYRPLKGAEKWSRDHHEN